MFRIIGKLEGKYVEPDDENAEDENRSAVVLLLSDGDHQHELTRVGFIRRNTKNPTVPFRQQLDTEVAKLQQAAEILTKLFEKAGETV